MTFQPDVHEKLLHTDTEVNPFVHGILSDRIAQELAETFKVLGDPTRVKVVHTLSREDLCVCDLSSKLDISQSAVSHQLRVLRNLKIVKGIKRGRKVFYSLVDEHIRRLFSESLEHVME
ncbi:MAG: helix-turn-helix transcriptional regulator [Deltaproteobacteria bacterium]|nr:helix-turn-helix transcriptional regulator [Deltaproteobacteria bacterium]MBW2306664.1 helix-turn-helix transcriptional regulator [Deltaproteobacteria bacterium]